MKKMGKILLCFLTLCLLNEQLMCVHPIICAIKEAFAQQLLDETTPIVTERIHECSRVKEELIHTRRTVIAFIVLVNLLLAHLITEGIATGVWRFKRTRDDVRSPTTEAPGPIGFLQMWHKKCAGLGEGNYFSKTSAIKITAKLIMCIVFLCAEAGIAASAGVNWVEKLV